MLRWLLCGLSGFSRCWALETVALLDVVAYTSTAEITELASCIATESTQHTRSYGVSGATVFAAWHH